MFSSRSSEVIDCLSVVAKNHSPEVVSLPGLPALHNQSQPTQQHGNATQE
jgi:hypothetical protein